MATTKVTFTLDRGDVEFARRAAELSGLSVSAWVSRAMRRQALADDLPRQRRQPVPEIDWDTALAIHQADPNAVELLTRARAEFDRLAAAGDGEGAEALVAEAEQALDELRERRAGRAAR